MVQAGCWPWREHPFPCQRLRVSQESCQPCSSQAETCTGCLSRAQGNDRGLLPPRWASSLLYTSMAVAWGAQCTSRLTPAMSTRHWSNHLTCMQVADGRDLPSHCASKIPVFTEGSSLLILAHCVCGNKHFIHLPPWLQSSVLKPCASSRAASLLPLALH